MTNPTKIAGALVDALHYNPDTGEFTWRKSRRNKIKAGDKAGWIDERGRPKIWFLGKARIASRLAWLYMTGEWPEHEIDHKNQDCSDNRWCNLRLATRSQNECNKAPKANNTSGVKGVRRVGNRWRAEITIDGKHRHIGYFPTKAKAMAARLSAVLDAQGHFAYEAQNND